MIHLLFILITCNALQAGQKQKTNLADNAHHFISERFLNYSERIDNFFGDQRINDAPNSSTLRFNTVTTKFEADDPFTEANMQLNLRLPKTENRFQLVVQSQGQQTSQADNNESELAQSDNDNRQTTTQRVRNATTAGLRYITDTAGIRTSTDFGIRVNLPPVAFARLRLNKNITLTNGHIFRPRHELFWLQGTGINSNTNLDFDKQLDDKFLLRYVNNLRWNDNDYIVRFTNGPALFQTIDDKKGVIYNAFILSQNEPEMNLDTYRLRITYRQLLYKNWFFGSLSPQMDWPRINNFYRTPSATLKFEVIMGAI